MLLVPTQIAFGGATFNSLFAVGYALAVLSALCNGSFVAFAKIDSVARVHLHPILL